jgi:ferredoxin
VPGHRWAVAPELLDVDDLGQAHEVGDGEVPPCSRRTQVSAAANCPEFAIVVEE